MLQDNIPLIVMEAITDPNTISHAYDASILYTFVFVTSYHKTQINQCHRNNNNNNVNSFRIKTEFTLKIIRVLNPNTSSTNVIRLCTHVFVKSQKRRLTNVTITIIYIRLE